MAAGTFCRPKAYIPGTRCDRRLEEAMRERVGRLMRTRPRNFPGSQPVSFSRQNLDDLTKYDYFLCEKSDGIRVLLYCTQVDGREMHFFIDRKNDYYVLPQMHFPSMASRTGYHIDTLVDGELVVDMASPHDEPQLTFLGFDCMVIEGENITHRSFDKRLGRLRNELILPYQKSRPRTDPGFRVDIKAMERGYAFAMMFDDILPKLTHDNDGLILTRRDAPYTVGTDPNILKWKPADENSIDFRLKLGTFPNPNSRGFSHEKPSFDLYIFLGHSQNANRPSYDYYAPLALSDKEWETLKSMNQVLDGRIVECCFGRDQQWHLKSRPDGTPVFRDDKPEANHISTARKVWETIQNGVYSRDLQSRSGMIKVGWKERAARAAAAAPPPPPSHHGHAPRM